MMKNRLSNIKKYDHLYIWHTAVSARAVLIAVLISFVCMLPGCGASRNDKNENALERDFSKGYVEYIASDELSTIKVPYTLPSGSPSQQVNDLLLCLHSDRPDGDYKRALPTDVEIVRWEITDGIVYLYFDSDYYLMPKAKEILVRAAIVRTLVQVEGVDGVQFYVDGVSLLDSSSNVVGVMTAGSFLENMGDQIATMEEKRLTLYFASADGQALTSEMRNVYYDSNTSLEKVVVDNLILGPNEESAQSALPAGTRVIDVTTTAGICYVNLSQDFLNQNYDITEAVTIYSIVDSLTELDSVQKVQIYINGETGGMYRDSVNLSLPLERNEKYMALPETENVAPLQE